MCRSRLDGYIFEESIKVIVALAGVARSSSCNSRRYTPIATAVTVTVTVAVLVGLLAPLLFRQVSRWEHRKSKAILVTNRTINRT
jgi:hypothetical protein